MHIELIRHSKILYLEQCPGQCQGNCIVYFKCGSYCNYDFDGHLTLIIEQIDNINLQFLVVFPQHY